MVFKIERVNRDNVISLVVENESKDKEIYKNLKFLIYEGF